MSDRIIIIGILFTFGFLSSTTKYELWQQHPNFSDQHGSENDLGKFEDRKRSVLDKGNMVLRLSNAATYGYDRWGLNHEFPAGSILKDGCCTYYWTQSPIVGALINGQPSVAVGVRGSYRDSEEEFEPLPGYDAGYVDTESNIGIALSDKPESWPAQWPAEVDESRTFFSEIYDFEGNLDTIISFPGVEPEVVDGFPDAPCGYGIQADREAYFVVTDNDPYEGNTYASNGGTGPMNVRVDTWVLNYSLTYGNDGLIFIEKMTNVGLDTLKSLYFGITGDPDSPSQGSSEWTDDLALLIEQDDPLIAEKLIDTTDAHLLGNLAIVYDSDDNSSGFVESNVGWVGLKFLGCTHIANDQTETDYNISAFNTFAYTDDATSDADAYYNQLAFGIEEPDNIAPHESDIFNKPYSYGPDVTWVIAAGPMDVAPGETVFFTFADFMGVNESDLLRNARLFQQLYENDCMTPLPPTPPIVEAIPGDEKVYLYWNGSESETSVDPVTGTVAFEGYRIYRSTDNGISWGTVINNFDGSPTEVYKPLAIYDLENEYSGPFAMSDPLLYYDMGSNSGLKYSYVDESVINGYEYYYSVSAYDHPDTWSGAPVDPLENPKQKDAQNTVKVVPEPKPAGYNREISPNHTSGFASAELTVVDADPFVNDPMDLAVYNDFTGSTEFEINAFTSCGEMYSDTNSNGSFDLGEPFEDLDGNGNWSEKIFNPMVNKNFWGVDWLTTDSAGNLLSIPIVDYDYDITSGQVKYVIDNMVPVLQNGIWGIDTVSNVEMISAASSGGIIDFSGLGINGKKTFSDLFGCDSDVHILDCAGNCFNYNIMDFIYSDGWCEDGSFGIDLRCEEYLFDYGDCCDVMDDADCDDLDLAGYCLDYYLQPGKPSVQNLRKDLELRFSENGSFVPTIYLKEDGLGYFSYNNVPFEIWTSDSEQFEDELDMTLLPVLVLLNLSGNDTLTIIDPLYAEIADNPGFYSFTRNFHIVPGFNVSDFFDLFPPDTTYIDYMEFSNIYEIIPFEAFKDYGWVIGLDQNSYWGGGEILKLSFENPVIPGEDVYRFSSDPPDYQVESSEDLDNVRVVPNPFKITSVFQNNIEVKELQFHNLPDVAVIRIFNTAGELVKLIKHEQGSDGFRGESIEAWNLRTYNEQEIAFGVYLFHVQADGFDKTGKFAVIK